jgi:tetratricopeptide (TPR) repeat protein
MPNEHLAFLRRAVARVSHGERAEAWADVRRAIAAAPQAGGIRLLSSRLLRLLGDYRGALDAARVAAALGTPSAAMQAFECARELGAHHQARDILEALLLQPAAATPATGDAQSVFEQAVHSLLRLYVDSGYDEAAAATLERYLPRVHHSTNISLLAVRVYVRREESGKALAIIRDMLADSALSPSVKLEVASHLLELGAFEAARAVYEALLERDRTALPPLEALGRLCLWIGDLPGALAYAVRIRAIDPNAATAQRIEAAVKILLGRPTDALPILDALISATPRDGEAYLWRAEAHLRMGRRAEAQADADRSMYHGYTFAALAIHLLGQLVPGPAPRPIWLHLLPELEQLCEDARTVLADHACDDEGRRVRAARSASQADQRGPALVLAKGLIALLERSLLAMRGNRTPLATWVRGDGALVRLRHPKSPRDAARDAMQLIKLASPEETLHALDGVAARFPESSMPWVYRGELQLWLGNYAAARSDLERAIAIHRQTRWAWYGLACLELVAGDPERALATCAEGIKVMDDTEGPVAFLCRGEAYRALGQLDDARAQLERSCELNPTRLSAWVNLALVHSLTGDRAAQRDIVRRLTEAAPALVSEAALELGDDVFRAMVLEARLGAGASAAGPPDAMVDRLLQHMLAMMRGNRSSSCITYFTADGQMRHVPQRTGRSGGDADAERRTLTAVQAVLARSASGG